MIELTTSLFIFLSAVHTGMPITANTAYATDATATSTTLTVADTTPLNLEAYVREYYKETPVLAEIAKCESEFRHYDKSGNVLHGTADPRDIGVMQINQFYHGDEAKRLGFDISTVEGNLGYAKYIYSKQGVEPWSHSAACWNKTASAKALATAGK